MKTMMERMKKLTEKARMMTATVSFVLFLYQLMAEIASLVVVWADASGAGSEKRRTTMMGMMEGARALEYCDYGLCWGR